MSGKIGMVSRAAFGQDLIAEELEARSLNRGIERLEWVIFKGCETFLRTGDRPTHPIYVGALLMPFLQAVLDASRRGGDGGPRPCFGSSGADPCGGDS